MIIYDNANTLNSISLHCFKQKKLDVIEKSKFPKPVVDSNINN
jgi:hypothetical protein